MYLYPFFHNLKSIDDKMISEIKFETCGPIKRPLVSSFLIFLTHLSNSLHHASVPFSFFALFFPNTAQAIECE